MPYLRDPLFQRGMASGAFQKGVPAVDENLWVLGHLNFCIILDISNA